MITVKPKKIVRQLLLHCASPRFSDALISYVAIRRLLGSLSSEYSSSRVILLSDRVAGLFSIYFQVMTAVYIARANGQRLSLNFVNSPYFTPARPEHSWWDYYFDMSSLKFFSNKIQNDNILAIESVSEQGKLAIAGLSMPREFGHNICRHFRLKDDIVHEIQQFREINFGEQFVIGLHYRGTDKVASNDGESQRVSFSIVADLLRSIPRAMQNSVLFVATDESAFLEKLRRLNLNFKFVHTNAVRSSDLHPIHLSTDAANPVAPDVKGRQAIVDCYLLASCHFLIRTDSNLSKACEYINPKLECVNISRYSRTNQIDFMSLSQQIAVAHRRFCLRKYRIQPCSS